MAVGIIRTNWSGTSGGPGLTQIAIAETTSGGVGSFFTATNVQTAVDAMRSFWNALTGLIPNEITLSVSPTVDIYDEVSGDLIGSVSAPTPPTNVVGVDTGVYSMAAGVKLSLTTGVIQNGRRVRGAVYIVPAGPQALANTGLAAGSARTTINNAGNAFKTALATPLLKHVVYSRPLPADHPNGPRAGFLTEVSTYDTNEKTAILRGRRD